VIKTVTDLVHILSIQITMMSVGWNKNQYKKEQEREDENG